MGAVCTVDDFYALRRGPGNHNWFTCRTATAMATGALMPLRRECSWPADFGGAGQPAAGPGTRYRAQTLEFHELVSAGDELITRITVTDKDPDGTVALATEGNMDRG